MDMGGVRQYLYKSQCIAKIGFQILTSVVKKNLSKKFFSSVLE